MVLFLFILILPHPTPRPMTATTNKHLACVTHWGLSLLQLDTELQLSELLPNAREAWALVWTANYNLWKGLLFLAKCIELSHLKKYLLGGLKGTLFTEFPPVQIYCLALGVRSLDSRKKAAAANVILKSWLWKEVPKCSNHQLHIASRSFFQQNLSLMHLSFYHRCFLSFEIKVLSHFHLNSCSRLQGLKRIM